MTNEKAHEIERHLDAIDDRLADCFSVFAEDGQENVAESTYKLAKRLLGVIVRTNYAMKLKVENIRVNPNGNITAKWFDGPNNSKSFAAGKCRYIYMEIGKSKFICHSNIDYAMTGIVRPERLNKDTSALIKTVFNHFYQTK